MPVLQRLCRLMCGGGFAPPNTVLILFLGYALIGALPQIEAVESEGHRPSAHQTAEPQQKFLMGKLNLDLQAGYDSVAEHYAAEFFEELERKPFDRELLDSFAEEVLNNNETGVVCEIGCGPGQVARYLKDRGLNMRGVDLSSEMVRVANRLNPDIPFSQGDMLSLDLAGDSLAGLVLFYSIIHIKREEVTQALAEMKRVLSPGGLLFLSFHGGEGELHRDEWYDKPVSIDFRLFEADEMAGYLEAAGFEEIRTMQREPYEFEHPTKRIYMFARK